jgi:hypothetical protein
MILFILSGCVEATNQSSAPTKTENTTSNADMVTIDALKNTISWDIIFLHDLATEYSIEIRSIEHQDDTVILELSIGDPQQYKDFVNALNNSEHLFPDVKFSSNSDEISKARIVLLSNVVFDIEKVLGLPGRPSECHNTDWYDKPNAIIMELTEKNGLIVKNPTYIGLIATNISPRIIELNEYVIVSYEFSLVNREMDKILAFVSDLDTVSAPIILKKAGIFVNIDETGAPELRVDIGLDYYAYCGPR